nr:MAG TPA: protein of unknown function UPF0054 [Caudoviricetes sp.]
MIHSLLHLCGTFILQFSKRIGKSLKKRRKEKILQALDLLVLPLVEGIMKNLEKERR